MARKSKWVDPKPRYSTQKAWIAAINRVLPEGDETAEEIYKRLGISQRRGGAVLAEEGANWMRDRWLSARLRQVAADRREAMAKANSDA